MPLKGWNTLVVTVKIVANEPLAVPLEVKVPNTDGNVFQKTRQRFADVWGSHVLQNHAAVHLQKKNAHNGCTYWSILGGRLPENPYFWSMEVLPQVLWNVLPDVLPVHHQFGEVIVLQDVLDFAKKSILNMKKTASVRHKGCCSLWMIRGHGANGSDQKQTSHPTVGSIHIFHTKVLKKEPIQLSLFDGPEEATGWWLTWVVRFPVILSMSDNTILRLTFRGMKVAPSCSTTAIRSVGTKVFRTKVMSRADSVMLSAGWASSDIYTPPLLCSPTHSLQKKPNEDADKMSLIKAVVKEKILWTEVTAWFHFRWGKKRELSHICNIFIERTSGMKTVTLRHCFNHNEPQGLWLCFPSSSSLWTLVWRPTLMSVCGGRIRTTLQSSTWDYV